MEHPEALPPETLHQAARLVDEGVRLHRAGKAAEARDRFTRALALAPLPSARNNLAVIALDVDGRPAEALEWLAPQLGSGAQGHPFAHALAVRAHVALGDAARAAAHLHEAVKGFEQGLPLQPPGVATRTFQEYTAVIIGAAGALGEDRQAWDLYRRWQAHHVAPESHYFGGVAAFNLGRWGQAAGSWRRLHASTWATLRGFADLVPLFERGTLPPLRLPYHFPDMERISRAAAQASGDLAGAMGRLVADPATLMVVLHGLFCLPSPRPAEHTAGMVGDLVAYGGPWGADLGRRLLEAGSVADEWKLAAAQGLIRAGVLGEGEPVTMLIGGTRRQVTITQAAFDFEPDPDLERQRQEALALRQGGRTADARRLLESLAQRPGRLYMPAVASLAALLLDEDDRPAAQRWLEVMAAAMPGHPGVRYNLAVLSLREGDRQDALRHLAAIDREALTPEMAERVRALQRHLASDLVEPLSAEEVMARIGEDFRADVDRRPIAPDRLTLERALARVPVQWLNAACNLHGLAVPAPLKRDRARQLAGMVAADPQAAVRALGAWDRGGRARELLRFVLAAGGVVRKATVTRRFGSDEGDGFWWDEQPPSSPLGLARLAGLVFVGRAACGSRREQVVVVPVDLREALAAVLHGRSGS
ncbi:MAG: hypothetical protein QN122_13775 [Armatimonadota bacterium]|nr:hypothetical protein [Armatimonadota bacterium]MDR7492500.1 hypothetical protein [Armatimonadota bacterium]